MKKPGQSRRPPGKSGGNRNGIPNRPSKGPANNRRSRPNSQSQRAKAVEQWMTAPSQTLSSHISIISKRNADNPSNKASGKKGGGGGVSKNNGKNKSYREKSRQNETAPSRDPRKKQYPNKTHRNNGARTGGSSRPAPKPSSEQKAGEKPRVANLDPFELFCAYHLGIGPDKQYKPSNINEVANRFALDPATIRQALKEYGMDSASLLDRDFDMALAQLDIQVAPEGVDRTELAKNIYEEYLEAPYQKRDWGKILEEDLKENRKVFGG